MALHFWVKIYIFYIYIYIQFIISMIDLSVTDFCIFLFLPNISNLERDKALEQNQNLLLLITQKLQKSK